MQIEFPKTQVEVIDVESVNVLSSVMKSNSFRNVPCNMFRIDMMATTDKIQHRHFN